MGELTEVRSGLGTEKLAQNAKISVISRNGVSFSF